MVERKRRDAVKDGRLKRQDEIASLEEGVRASIITGHEAESVRRAIIARREVIEVDDFPRL
jgi:hypothetical protein